MSQVIAMLGPTNTGKTYRAIQRMLDYKTGMMGLPLRLLAREVYDRVTAQVGEAAVALITGEEKRVPEAPRYWICTVEAMPVSREVEFLAVDELQLAAHPQRGHVFTDRLLHARGTEETWFLGSDTMRHVLHQMVPVATVEPAARLSQLSFAGAHALSRVQPRTALVAFSVEEVYALAERLRASKGGAAVVLGALSPRTRNAQVAMFQAGEVDYMVATDAIGMGLNLDVQHVRFTSLQKFDGREVRSLELAEMAQIAGRAGRYMQDGTFGTIMPEELPKWAADAMESHRFAPITHVRWRAHALDFSSLQALDASLMAKSPEPWFVPAERAEDVAAFRALAPRIHASDEATVKLAWEVASVPDFRKLLLEAHVAQLEEIFVELNSQGGVLRDAWFEPRVASLESGPTDVETLTFRIASLRTWAYVAHKSGWLRRAESWRERVHALEDRLSDELHQALVGRFVAKKAKPKRVLPVKGHPFAGLAKLVEVAPVVDPLEALPDAPHEAFVLNEDGQIYAAGRAIARLVRGKTPLLPNVKLVIATKPGLASRIERRVLAFVRDAVTRAFAPIDALDKADSAAVRALGHALRESLGVVALRDAPRLTERDRDILSRLGVRIGREITATIDYTVAAALTHVS